MGPGCRANATVRKDTKNRIRPASCQTDNPVILRDREKIGALPIEATARVPAFGLGPQALAKETQPNLKAHYAFGRRSNGPVKLMSRLRTIRA
jgi:hypothetical protein